VIPYWFLFSLPVIALAMGADRPDRRHLLPLLVFATFAVLMIGTRYQVGGDWVTYSVYFSRQQFATFGEAVYTPDAAYAVLNWCVARLGVGIVGVNLVCGAIFVWGLIDFAWRTPNPWMAVSVAVPYLVVVVAMGYTRQSVALGFEFLALRRLAEAKYTQFFVLVVCAAAFHKTAIALSLLGIFSGPHPFTVWRGVLGAGIAYVSFLAFLQDHYEQYLKNYLEGPMDSTGGLIRMLMNAVPAALLLTFYQTWSRRLDVRGPWVVFSLAAFISLGLVQQASTATDRLALYLTPLQLYVWSSLPKIFSGALVTPSVVAYHATVLFVWLNFASHAHVWLPYQTFLVD
jgi:hypothetical protein